MEITRKALIYICLCDTASVCKYGFKEKGVYQQVCVFIHMCVSLLRGVWDSCIWQRQAQARGRPVNRQSSSDMGHS